MAILGGLAAASALPACARRAGEEGEVVLYSSVDDFVLREVVEAFEAETGITVRLLGDTEATKTTGLIQRLIAESDRPRADVWWSSEPFGTIRLGRLGLLEPTGVEPPPVTDSALAGGLDDAGGLWHGFALRARVLCTRRDTDPPTRLRDLTDPALRGRVGIARPRFGTTRGHMAALAATFGHDALRAWLGAMVENGVRVYDSNSTVVRAVAEAEIDVCLTDTDDVWVAQRNERPVRVVYESPDPPGASPEGLPSPGPMLIPNTVARVRSGPNGPNARRLIEYLLTGPAEAILARSDSHNLPVRTGPFPDLEPYLVPDGWLPDLEAGADAEEAAMALCDEILGDG